MPVYNECPPSSKSSRLCSHSAPVRQLVFVDDCSQDCTWDKLQPFAQIKPRLKLVRHKVNQGKGTALRTGSALAISDIVIIQDADREYGPKEYYRLVAPVLSGKADVVFGSRFQGGMHIRLID